MFFFRIALYFTNTNRAMAYFSYILPYFDSRLIPSFPQYPGHPAGCLCTIPKLGTLRDLWYRLFAMCVFPSFLGEEQHLIRISSDTCFTRIVGTQPPGGHMGTSEGVCNPQGDTAAFLQSSLSRPTISTHPMGSQCVLLLLTIIFKCGEDCPCTFSSQQGLNQHCSTCPTYHTTHARTLARISTTLHVPEKCSTSSSEVSLHSLFHPSLTPTSGLQVETSARPAPHPHRNQGLSAEASMDSASQEAARNHGQPGPSSQCVTSHKGKLQLSTHEPPMESQSQPMPEDDPLGPRICRLAARF
ncbi:hypothetical protein JVT61DRAFT_7926 [Boletus reticuloceps]|uniref:Uncharacterized protein n=1 Tax=Boletus reticuloceps TaxID=495285 RepID=A0A8I3A6M0_9AGAM|nr:hypothetical protein JVT61DRAFT_7926 [Boletus reticuloceps]